MESDEIPGVVDCCGLMRHRPGTDTAERDESGARYLSGRLRGLQLSDMSPGTFDAFSGTSVMSQDEARRRRSVEGAFGEVVPKRDRGSVGWSLTCVRR